MVDVSREKGFKREWGREGGTGSYLARKTGRVQVRYYRLYSRFYIYLLEVFYILG